MREEKECKHKRIARGISINWSGQSKEYYSYCYDCDKRWNDKGKRFDSQQRNRQ